MLVPGISIREASAPSHLSPAQSSLRLLVSPSHVPAAADPSPANEAKIEGTTIVAPRDGTTESRPPVPYIAALPARLR